VDFNDKIHCPEGKYTLGLMHQQHSQIFGNTAVQGLVQNKAKSYDYLRFYWDLQLREMAESKHTYTV
jgi:hypothetical protein